MFEGTLTPAAALGMSPNELQQISNNSPEVLRRTIEAYNASATQEGKQMITEPVPSPVNGAPPMAMNPFGMNTQIPNQMQPNQAPQAPGTTQAGDLMGMMQEGIMNGWAPAPQAQAPNSGPRQIVVNQGYGGSIVNPPVQTGYGDSILNGIANQPAGGAPPGLAAQQPPGPPPGIAAQPQVAQPQYGYPYQVPAAPPVAPPAGQTVAGTPQPNPDAQALAAAAQALTAATQAMGKPAETPQASFVESLTEEDKKAIGGDKGLNILQKLAEEKAATAVARADALEAQHKKQLENLNLNLNEAFAKMQNQAYAARLRSVCPDFAAVEANPGFQAWLNEFDPMVGGTRREHAKRMNAEGNADGVGGYANMWKQMVTLGQAPAPQAALPPGAQPVAMNQVAQNPAQVYNPQAQNPAAYGQPAAAPPSPYSPHATPVAHAQPAAATASAPYSMQGMPQAGNVITMPQASTLWAHIRGLRAQGHEQRATNMEAWLTAEYEAGRVEVPADQVA